MRLTITALGLAALAVAMPAWAKDKKDTAPPAIYQAVVDCRAIADAPTNAPGRARLKA